MGFFTGFFGGFTLASSVLYLTIHLHLANRHHQHILLREQIDLLNTLSLPTTARTGLIGKGNAAADVMARRGYLPRQRPGIVELGKEKWNQEIRLLVRRAQEVRWEDVQQKVGKGWEIVTSLAKNNR
ncbi:hypothetical protein PRK78_001132 [Emydomyces testavorans]|uniref:MICOS complex subunit MIC12 n=1 Tax=Emydomyces testavorans TaxID=2070801 RepID=A0AAF0DCS6_9EURO|nr:hypothetical protein PRK78_001132 [Emydomyces testavorans]